MKIIITTDSTSDMPKEIREMNGIMAVPLAVNLGEDEFYDGVNLTNEKIFDFVEKTGFLPKTAARSSLFYKEFFLEARERFSADKIVHISLSSEISSSFNNAKLASEELDFVTVIDSLALSSGCSLLCLSAIDKIKEGKSLDEIVNEINAEIPRVQTSFIINDLKYLYKGGRCSALAMFGANILSIKPKIKVTNGKMGVDKKYMGKLNSVLGKYVDDLLREYQNPNLERVFITFSTCDEEIVENISEKLKQRGFKNVIANFAGATITSHCGKNCLGVLFISND